MRLIKKDPTTVMMKPLLYGLSKFDTNPSGGAIAGRMRGSVALFAVDAIFHLSSTDPSMKENGYERNISRLGKRVKWLIH